MVGINIDMQGREEVERAMQELGIEIMPTTRRQLYNSLLSVRNSLTAHAPLPDYPINWDSEKQRRAYFATDGFGHGIPYRRTGTYSRSWRVVRAGDGYAIENPTNYALYVGGDYDGAGQSNIHRGRWPSWIDIVEERVNETVPPEIEDALQIMARQKGLE